jgi:hypothetical protein
MAVGRRARRDAPARSSSIDRRRLGHAVAIPAILVHDFLPVVALREIEIVAMT